MNCTSLLEEFFLFYSSPSIISNTIWSHPHWVLSRVIIDSEDYSPKNEKDNANKEIYLVMVSTPHLILGQLMYSSVDNDNMTQGNLKKNESNVVTLWKYSSESVSEVVSCPPIILISHYKKSSNHEDIYTKNKYQKSVGTVAEAVVVIGTTFSRILSLPLVIIRSNNIYTLQVKDYPVDPLQTEYNNNDIHFKGLKPKGGVQSLSFYHLSPSQSILWITYGNGILIRLLSSVFFGTNNEKDEDAVVVCEVEHETYGWIVFPLPRSYPTIFSQSNDIICDKIDEEKMIENEKYRFGKDGFRAKSCEKFEALSYLSSGTSFTQPDESQSLSFLRFYSSESLWNSCVTNENNISTNIQYKSYNSELEKSSQMLLRHALVVSGKKLVTGTTSVAEGLWNGIGGVVEAVFQGSNTKHPNHNSYTTPNSEVKPESHQKSSHIKPLCSQPPIPLILHTFLFDSPRRITHVSIDPMGEVAACADALGRVQLVDLSTKQVLRIWKGVRNAKCHWMRLPWNGNNDDIYSHVQLMITYLIIHTSPRNVIEIYRMIHGPRVAVISFPPIFKTEIAVSMPFPSTIDGTPIVPCFLIRMLEDDDGKINVLIKSLESFVRNESLNARQAYNSPFLSMTHLIHRHEKINPNNARLLQMLQQILSNDAVYPPVVYDLLTQMTSISEWEQALDILAFSSDLLSGSNDSLFHSLVVKLATNVFETINSHVMKIMGCSDHVRLEQIAHKIQLHTRIISTYNLMCNSKVETQNKIQNKEVGLYDNSSKLKPNLPFYFIDEACSWIHVFDTIVTRDTGDFFLSSDISEKLQPYLSFATLAKIILQDSSCVSTHSSPPQACPLYLGNSTRDRALVLRHLFQPFLINKNRGYATTVVSSIFESLGLRQKCYNNTHDTSSDTMLYYYAEWFMTLSPNLIRNATTTGTSLITWLSPMIQWIHNQLRSVYHGHTKTNILAPLYQVCQEANDLSRAFLLAITCRLALSTVSTSLQIPWDKLLHKLRTCLVVSCRLKYISFMGESFPITVSNLEDGNFFTIYELLARDEIRISTKQYEIWALEWSYRRSSSLFFNAWSPAIPLTDSMVCCYTSIQRSKSSGTLNGKEIKSHSFTCEPREWLNGHSSPLLHTWKIYNHPEKLAAHRALTFSRMWSNEPKSLRFLKNSISALKILEKSSRYEYIILIHIVVEKIWSVHIRPIFRAKLFGFETVHELREEIYKHFCIDYGWMQNLSKLSLTILSLLRKTYDQIINDIQNRKCYKQTIRQGKKKFELPPLFKDDLVFQSIFRSYTLVKISSLDIHRGVISSCQINNNTLLLKKCISQFDELFLPSSLSVEFRQDPSLQQYQRKFISESLRREAAVATGPTVNQFVLDNNIHLGKKWGIEKGSVLVEFFLTMYSLGKDHMINNMVNGYINYLGTKYFISGSVDIICIRLNASIGILEKNTKKKSIISRSDADLRVWVEEKVEAALKLNNYLKEMKGQDYLNLLPITKDLIQTIIHLDFENVYNSIALNVMLEVLLDACK